MKESKVKRVEDSMVETVHIVRPTHLNPAGRLFGGLMKPQGLSQKGTV